MPDAKAEQMAERLHGAAIRMLRMLRRRDRASGLTGPRLSTLSVLVFGGPTSLAGLVTREPEPGNRRKVRIAATPEGVLLLEEGRARRVAALTERLARLADSERRALERAVELLERVVR